MLTDVFTMIWKEWKEMLKFQGSSRSSIIGLLIMIGFFAVLMPLQWGTLFVESAVSLSLWVVIPMMLVGTMVADSFAGERERHTLETLLASRLSDRAILLGKIFAIVSFEWVITQLVFVLALIPVNIFHGQGQLLLYTPEVALSGMLLSFLVSMLMSNIGIMVSLRAESVRQAQQKLGLSVFIIAYLVPTAGVYLLRYVSKETVQKVLQPILTGDIGLGVLLASAVLVLLTVASYLLAKARFQRTRLILNE
jgi:ABC-2 type transport system permease protein